jgi:hypothetical protein
VDGVLSDAGLTPGQLSAVAVTIGPGLSLCLQVRRGVELGGGQRGGEEGKGRGERKVSHLLWLLPLDLACPYACR